MTNNSEQVLQSLTHKLDTHLMTTPPLSQLHPKTEGDKDLGSELREHNIRRLVLQVARYPPWCLLHSSHPTQWGTIFILLDSLRSEVGKLLYDALKTESSVMEILKEPYYNTSQVYLFAIGPLQEDWKGVRFRNFIFMYVSKNVFVYVHDA